MRYRRFERLCEQSDVEIETVTSISIVNDYTGGYYYIWHVEAAWLGQRSRYYSQVYSLMRKACHELSVFQNCLHSGFASYRVQQCIALPSSVIARLIRSRVEKD